MPPTPRMPTLNTTLLEAALNAQKEPGLGISRVNTAASIRSPIVEDEPMEDYAVPFGDDLEDWNEKLGLMWNQIMDQGRYSTSASYTNVQVLMLSHDAAEGNDDLNVKQEMSDLERVFKDTYNFGVTRRVIKKNNKMHKRSQAQVNAIVANWAYKHDGTSTLLIVYFAGHGVPSDSGELELVGRQELTHQVGAGFNKVVWDYTERNLHYLIADVLQIFDCCYAGTMSGEHKDEDQTIEFLAACSGEELTRKPGPESFTSALIWSLGELARQGGRFTVSHLLQRIQKAPNFPANQQHPMLIRRARKPRHQRIIIHTLDRSDAKSAAKSPSPGLPEDSSQRRRHSEEQYVLDLKFAFHSWPTDQDIRHLAQDLNTSVIARKLPMSYISWGGITPKQAIARQVVATWRALRSPPMKREREDDSDDYDVSKKQLMKKAVTDLENIGEQVGHIGEQMHQYHDEDVQRSHHLLKDLVHKVRSIPNGKIEEQSIGEVLALPVTPASDATGDTMSTN